MMISDWDITRAEPTDLPTLHGLNERAVPHVNSLTTEALAALISQACYCGVARRGSTVGGFVLALRPGSAYQSLNYRWFDERSSDFVYIDRIVVAEYCRGMGIGQALYDRVERFAVGHAHSLACEVNIVPPNPGSTEFHRRYGFVEVGQQDVDSSKRVSLLRKALSRDRT